MATIHHFRKETPDSGADKCLKNPRITANDCDTQIKQNPEFCRLPDFSATEFEAEQVKNAGLDRGSRKEHRRMTLYFSP